MEEETHPSEKAIRKLVFLKRALPCSCTYCRVAKKYKPLPMFLDGSQSSSYCFKFWGPGWARVAGRGTPVMLCENI